MAVNDKGLLKLPRRVFRVKNVAKSLLFVALMLAIVQIVTYRSIETENVVHYKGWLACVHTLESAFQPNLQFVNLLNQTGTLKFCNISFGVLG
jgi:hypothetical protein